MWIQDLPILNMSLSTSLLTVTTFGLCGALLVVLSAAPCVSTLQGFCLALITMFLLAVHCCEGCFLKVAWKEDGGAFKQGRLKPGISSWKEVQGRGHCTWPLSSLVLQMYVQSGFLTFGRFALEFCRHRILTDTLILPTGVVTESV